MESPTSRVGQTEICPNCRCTCVVPCPTNYVRAVGHFLMGLSPLMFVAVLWILSEAYWPGDRREIISGGVFLAGAIIICLRYHHTRALTAGVIGFVILAGTSVLPMLLVPGRYWNPTGYYLGLSVTSLAGTALVLTGLIRTASPRKKKLPLFAKAFLPIFITLVLVYMAVMGIVRGGGELMHSTMIVTLWTSLVLSVLAVFGVLTDQEMRREFPFPKVLWALPAGLLVIAMLVFAVILMARSCYLLCGLWVAIHLVGALLGIATLWACAATVYKRFSNVRWIGLAGITAFGVLTGMALFRTVLFLIDAVAMTGVSLPAFIWDLISFAQALAWATVLLFLVLASISGRMETVSWPLGFRMTEARWAGLGAIVLGLGVCSWQMYEVTSTNHFTFWMLKGIIPLPVIVLGLLLVLGGALALIVDE